MSASALLLVRAERDSDQAKISNLHRSAFGGDAEARLVDALRRDGSVVLSLVAERDGEIVGNVVYSRLLVDGMQAGASALAPVSVAPQFHGQGTGSLLIREAHRHLAKAGERLVLVLGDPAYYVRFGFSQDAAQGLHTPYDGPHLMVLHLDDRAASQGAVSYPRAFADLA